VRTGFILLAGNRHSPSRLAQLFLCVLCFATLARSAWAAEPTRKSARGAKTKHSPIPAAADIAVDLVAAKAAFQDGLRAFNLGLWDDAIAGFQRSYRLSGDAALLFNVAQAQRQAGHRKEALIAYKAYLRENPETPHRELVEAKIQDLETRPAAAPPPADTKTSSDQLTGILENPFEPLAHETPPEPVRLESVPPVESDPAVAGALPVAPSAAIPPGAPTAPMTATPLVQTETGPQPNIAATPVVSRWWLWTGIGAAVVAGVVTAVILSTRAPQRDGSCPPGFDGCLPVGK